MELSKLKTLLVDKKNIEFPEDLIIFVCEENYFIANQYVDAICEKRKLLKNKIFSINETTESALSLVFNYQARMNILVVDTFDEMCQDYSEIKNIIVLCKKIDKVIDNKVKDFVTIIPKLKEWQIEDYIMQTCEGTSEDNAKWLYTVTKGDIYRIQNELDKINLFPVAERKDIFTAFKNDINSDLFNLEYYELPEALYLQDNKSMLTIINYLLHRTNCEMDPMSIISQLLTKYKQYLFIFYTRGISADSLGISSKYLFVFKKYAPKISLEAIKNQIKFLSAIDLKIKNGLLDMPRINLTDYIICNSLARGN